LGRPKGTIGKSKLDGREDEIKRMIAGGINKANLARYLGVSWATIDNFIKTRKLL
jgi:DNA-binding CsgD family transcriptional regulator